jgi:hypothetical protein
MFQEYEIVVLKKALPGTPVTAGAEGTIIRAFSFANPPVYDVDFLDENHKNLGIFRVIGTENLDIKISFEDQFRQFRDTK